LPDAASSITATFPVQTSERSSPELPYIIPTGELGPLARKVVAADSVREVGHALAKAHAQVFMNKVRDVGMVRARTGAVMVIGDSAVAGAVVDNKPVKGGAYPLERDAMASHKNHETATLDLARFTVPGLATVLVLLHAAKAGRLVLALAPTERIRAAY